MARSELENSISILLRKVDSLLEEQSALRIKIADLEEINNKLIDRQKQDEQRIINAEKKIEFLTLSHRLADSPEALVSARNIVSKLIRTVDNCIRMLKED